MARLPEARGGEVLQAKGRPLAFSYFPVTRSVRRYGLYDTVFAVSPWSVMHGQVTENLSGSAATEALAFLEQAEDFFRAASSGVSTNPVLTYYAFVNLAKVLIRLKGYGGSMDRAMHGLQELTEPEGDELNDSRILVKDSGDSLNIFPELVARLGFPRPNHGDELELTELLPQAVVGHRIWRESELGHKERFVDLKHIDFVSDSSANTVWLRLYVGRQDLARYDITRKRLLEEGSIDGEFREVKVESTDRRNDRDRLVCLEQVEPTSYTGRATDVVANLVDLMRAKLWRIASSVPQSGYRRYYLHLTPPEESARLPQLASLWAMFFYFGSVVRYRPHLFDEIISGRYGAFVSEFVSAQPEQMLYLLASELCEREIARPAIT